METLAYLVFYLCVLATIIAVIAAIDYLVHQAKRGDQRARIMLATLAFVAVVSGFGWSIDYLWGL